MDYRYTASSFERWSPINIFCIIAVTTGIGLWLSGAVNFNAPLFLIFFAVPLGVSFFLALQPVVSFQGKILRKQLDTYSGRRGGTTFDYRLFIDDGSEVYVPKKVFVRLDEQDEVRGARQQRELFWIEVKIDASRDIGQRIDELEAKESAIGYRNHKLTLLVNVFFTFFFIFDILQSKVCTNLLWFGLPLLVSVALVFLMYRRLG